MAFNYCDNFISSAISPSSLFVRAFPHWRFWSPAPFLSRWFSAYSRFSLDYLFLGFFFGWLLLDRFFLGRGSLLFFGGFLLRGCIPCSLLFLLFLKFFQSFFNITESSSLLLSSFFAPH